MSAGRIDNSFNKNGYFLINDTTQIGVQTIIVQNDNKIITAGYYKYYNNEYFIYINRYTPNGIIDKTFATNGVIQSNYKTNGDTLSNICFLQSNYY